LQFRSSELTEETYQQINIHTNDLIEHINLEKAEINNVRMRLTQQTLDNVDLAINTTYQKSPGSTYTESIPKVEASKQNEATHIIVADETKRIEEKAVQGNTNNNETDENSWLNHVIQNE
jgi:ABC-type metal ion transport system substrate-binding protein